ncbi:hypothetical protein GCM10009754_43080 [Amycolatopsis minnesotensis]|uniref:Uncharacterized protein n=1 Tax=Amycolatopsis minnesotensis TaxID=337894 RepID=A0ABP5CNH1_9PSEU
MRAGSGEVGGGSAEPHGAWSPKGAFGESDAVISPLVAWGVVIVGALKGPFGALDSLKGAFRACGLGWSGLAKGVFVISVPVEAFSGRERGNGERWESRIPGPCPEGRLRGI